MPGEKLTIVTLNTLGLPRAGARLAERYAAIGDQLDAGDADVVCFQEVITWWHLRLLARRMRSFRHVCYRSSPAGPAGALVTFSRLPVSGVEYRRFGVPPRAPRISRRIRLRGALKGALVTRLPEPELTVVSTHPIPNSDGDWSPPNRFYPLHRAQLGALAAVLRDVSGPAVVCGDFNVSRDSPLMREFLTDTSLSDAFGGTCPPTYRAEYLPPGATPHCIDFILTSPEVRTTAAALQFADKVSLPSGPAWLSDHIGLSATLDTRDKRPSQLLFRSIQSCPSLPELCALAANYISLASRLSTRFRPLHSRMRDVTLPRNWEQIRGGVHLASRHVFSARLRQWLWHAPWRKRGPPCPHHNPICQIRTTATISSSPSPRRASIQR